MSLLLRALRSPQLAASQLEVICACRDMFSPSHGLHVLQLPCHGAAAPLIRSIATASLLNCSVAASSAGFLNCFVLDCFLFWWGYCLVLL